MKIYGIGIDLIEVARIRHAVERLGQRFIENVYTETERAFCEGRANRYLSLAARFAAKEAFLKALGTGYSQGISWRDVEVIDNERSRPTYRITGKAKEFLGARRVHLSISHVRDYATAIAVIEE